MPNTRPIVDTDYAPVVYRTWAQYRERVGVAPPPFDPSKPRKYWATPPDAVVNGGRLKVYHNVPAFEVVDGGTRYRQDPGGAPFFEDLYLPADQEDVNIPPDVGVFPDKTAPRQDFIPPPMRLQPGESLAFSFNGGLQIRTGPDDPEPGSGFTEADRKLLTDIHAAITAKQITQYWPSPIWQGVPVQGVPAQSVPVLAPAGIHWENTWPQHTESQDDPPASGKK